tara:strand:+ start:3217 stop:3903 length:687 start_codon:yes stop_codon:yes gene_type:complete
MKKLFNILFIILLFSSCEENVVEAIHGCFDAQACNYNPDTTYDNNSCEYESCADCLGVTNGDAELDSCDVCQGDGTYCNPVNLSFGDLYYNENEELVVPIAIDSPQSISGFQFNLTENDIITTAEGGISEEYGFSLTVDPTSEESSNLVLGFSFTADLLPSGINGILTNLTVIPNGSQVCFEQQDNFFIKTVNPNNEIDLIHDAEDGSLDGVIQYQINFGDCKEISTI